jgi:hypothetical protein
LDRRGTCRDDRPGGDEPRLRPAPRLNGPGEREQHRHRGDDDADAAGIHRVLGGEHEHVERGQPGRGEQREADELAYRRPPDPAAGERGEQQRAGRVAQRLPARRGIVAQPVEHRERGPDGRHPRARRERRREMAARGDVAARRRVAAGRGAAIRGDVAAQRRAADRIDVGGGHGCDDRFPVVRSPGPHRCL